MSNDQFYLQNRIQELTRKYENALQNGEEFSVLKEIRDELRLLTQQMNGDGNGNGDGNSTARDAELN